MPQNLTAIDTAIIYATGSSLNRTSLQQHKISQLFQPTCLLASSSQSSKLAQNLMYKSAQLQTLSNYK